MFSPINRNPTELDSRITKLERLIRVYSDVQQEQGNVLQNVVESTLSEIEYIHQNNIRNGDLSWDRNRYIYDTDWAGTDAANVSQEAAHMYVHPISEEVRTTGSISSASTALTISDPIFVGGDAGKRVVVEGAGSGGADLVTTISGAPGSSTTATLTTPAGTTVTGVLVRVRMLEFLEDSTDENADGNTATNSALKTSSHTKYATTPSDPRYNRTDGWVEWSDPNYMLTCPLAYNTVDPSKQYNLTFLYRLANPVDGEDEVFIDFFAGIYDNSTGRWGFLEGQQPGLSATVIGTPGSTSRDYMILMYLADGKTVATSTVTVANTNTTLDTTNYVALSWDQEPGVVRSEVYRNTGGTYHRVALPYPATTFYDTGGSLNTEVGFPAADATRFKAFTQVTEGNFATASRQWKRGHLNIVIPRNYDSSKTTDKQWLCLGFNTTALMTGSGGDHALNIDLISLDDKYGIFSKCPLDFQAKRGVSTSAASGSQGTAGGGGNPVPPGGGGYCPTFNELIETNKGPVRAIDLVDNEDTYRIKNRLGEFVKYTAEIGGAQPVATLLAEQGFQLTGSLGHKIFRNDVDIDGKDLTSFKERDIIYTIQGHIPVLEVVLHFKPQHVVRITLAGTEKGYWQNGVAVHNAKPVQPLLNP